MIKVLVISTVRFLLNGITSVILNYYRNMDRSDMKIDFVVPNEISMDYRRELEAGGSQIYYLPRKTDPVSYRKRLFEIMKDNKYDIVHVHGNSALMLLDILPAVKAGIPVRIVHSHNTTCTHRALHKILLPYFDRCYTQGFACGEQAGRWLFRKRPFDILNNGIDLEKFGYNEKTRDEYRKKINAGNRIVLGNTAIFVEQKNHEFLLDMYSELVKDRDDYLLLMIGGGALLDKMKEKAKALGIEDSVVFAGQTTDVDKYLQAMDVFLLPSLYEGLPVVLVEAQSAGLKCLVSDRVSEEADLTDSLEFLPLDHKCWINAVKGVSEKEDSRPENSERYKGMLRKAGYDIKENACRMKELYLKYYRDSGAD